GDGDPAVLPAGEGRCRCVAEPLFYGAVERPAPGRGVGGRCWKQRTEEKRDGDQCGHGATVRTTGRVAARRACVGANASPSRHRWRVGRHPTVPPTAEWSIDHAMAW